MADAEKDLQTGLKKRFDIARTLYRDPETTARKIRKLKLYLVVEWVPVSA
jgi:hypothetical protein